MPVMAYEVTLAIDSENTIIKLADTYPSVSDWRTASEFAIHMMMRSKPDSRVEFVDCSERVHEVYSSWGYISETPPSIQ